MRAAIIAIVTLTSLLSARAEGLARIYVYAQRQTPVRSWLPISCDGAVVAKLKRGTFFAVNVASGRHLLSNEPGVPVFVDVRSGEESFVRLDWNFDVGRPVISELHVVLPPQARREMINLTYIDSSKVLSRSASKADPHELRQRLQRRTQQDQ